jgi:hypothetical protein
VVTAPIPGAVIALIVQRAFLASRSNTPPVPAAHASNARRMRSLFEVAA